MGIKNESNGNRINIILFLLGCAGFIVVIALDKLYWHTGILKEGWPNFNPGHLVRTIIIAISSFAVFWSLIGDRKPQIVLYGNTETSIAKSGLRLTLAVSTFFVLLFVFEPSTFNVLSKEDNLIEWGSALLLFGGSFVVSISLFRSRNNINIPKITKLSLAFLSFIFFIIAMEEVSWFQRLLEIETPKAFEENIQYEMNLHNFATDIVEHVYYFSAFLFLVILPFFRLLFLRLFKNNYFNAFAARPFVIILGAIICAYNFDMWDTIFTQIAFFGSVTIMIAITIFNSNRNERYLSLFATVLIASTQAIFLLYGENFDRVWEVTKYKEFFISLGFFIYSLDLSSNLKPAYLAEKAL